MPLSIRPGILSTGTWLELSASSGRAVACIDVLRNDELETFRAAIGTLSWKGTTYDPSFFVAPFELADWGTCEN